MKRYRFVTVVAMVTAGLLALAAGAQGAAGSKKSSALPAKGDEHAGDWQKKWEDTLSAAKKEGEVLIYLNAPSGAREAISDAFYKKFGLKVGVVLGSGEMLTSKLISEYQSGLHQVDLFMPGATSILRAGSHGIMARLEPMLILPEVRDPRNWLDNKLPYYDKGGVAFGYLAVTNPAIVYNSDLVKEGEITSPSDLLKPQWKGQTVMYDPSVSGSGLSGSYFLTLEWGGNEKVFEYITAMIKKQDTIMTREMGQQAEWVARGKYKVALWPMLAPISQFMKAGAHLAAASIKEKERVGSSNGALGAPAKPAHPNAAIVFINWYLSREGQAVVVKAMGAGSARTDVSTEGVHPIYIPKPGLKYNIENEETTLLRPKFQKSLIKFITELNK